MHALLFPTYVFIVIIGIFKQAVYFLMTNLKCALGVWVKYVLNKVKEAIVSSLGFWDHQGEIYKPSSMLLLASDLHGCRTIIAPRIYLMNVFLLKGKQTSTSDHLNGISLETALVHYSKSQGEQFWVNAKGCHAVASTRV